MSNTIGSDPRLTPARADLAADHLRGSVEADRYATGVMHQVLAGVAPLRTGPGADAGLATELLFGEVFSVYDDIDGWAWGQSAVDGYVGYVPSSMLRPSVFRPTHSCAALRTFLYPAPDIKLPPLDALTLGARVNVLETEGAFARIDGDAWISSRHLTPLQDREPDFVATAERFTGAPYLWGGRSVLGLDCSGLVQISLGAAGVDAPRDTDMQEAEVGSLSDNPLARGDLVFWQGHVAIMCNATTVIHASATDMLVVAEPFAALEQRLADGDTGPVTSVKRLG